MSALVAEMKLLPLLFALWCLPARGEEIGRWTEPARQEWVDGHWEWHAARTWRVVITPVWLFGNFCGWRTHLKEVNLYAEWREAHPPCPVDEEEEPADEWE